MPISAEGLSLLTRPLKSLVKRGLHRLLTGRGDYRRLRVLSGPAKGSTLRLDLRKEGSYWLGTYDKWVFDRLPIERYLPLGSIAWDCGAYVGYYSACFRRLVGDAGTVHTFEASGPNYARLSQIAADNGWRNVHVHHLAVGPDHATIEFVENLGGSSGPYGLSKAYDASDRLVISRVACAGVDELVEEYGVPAPDFIKFDLESAEEFALHNGPRVFTNRRPIVLLELHGQAAKNAAGDFFKRYDYEGVPVIDYESRQYVCRSRADLDRIKHVPHMMICTPM